MAAVIIYHTKSNYMQKLTKINTKTVDNELDLNLLIIVVFCFSIIQGLERCRIFLLKTNFYIQDES